MLLLEISRKSAIHKHIVESDRECGCRRSRDTQCATPYRFQDDDIDFLKSLQRQKNVDPPAEDEE